MRSRDAALRTWVGRVGAQEAQRLVLRPARTVFTAEDLAGESVIAVPGQAARATSLGDALAPRPCLSARHPQQSKNGSAMT